jgi:hypothetical protein
MTLIERQTEAFAIHNASFEQREDGILVMLHSRDGSHHEAVLEPEDARVLWSDITNLVLHKLMEISARQREDIPF